jgi:hypothetical protein
VELRSRQTNDATGTGADKLSDESNQEECAEAAPEERTEERGTAELPDTGILRVEERAGPPQFFSLADAFKERGFPAQTATLEWGEARALTFAGTVTDLSQLRRDGGPLGADTRWAWPAFQSIAVGSDVTSVQVFAQSARTLGTATDVVRNIDAVSTKPSAQTAGSVTTVPLRQVAAVESSIPNVYLENQGMSSIVETDLRLTINGGLDSLVQTGLNTSGTVTKGTFDVLNAVLPRGHRGDGRRLHAEHAVDRPCRCGGVGSLPRWRRSGSVCVRAWPVQSVAIVRIGRQGLEAGWHRSSGCECIWQALRVADFPEPIRGKCRRDQHEHRPLGGPRRVWYGKDQRSGAGDAVVPAKKVKLQVIVDAVQHGGNTYGNGEQLKVTEAQAKALLKSGGVVKA